MDDHARGQVVRSAADVYETFFVPALFAEWTPRLADAATLGPGDAVLDVACGTGVLAREAAHRVGASGPGGAAERRVERGPTGRVVGLDLNPGMLAVARRKAPAIEWREGRAEALPFADGEFDAVVSQFGLMFFEDRAAALAEMWRVLDRGGRLALAVWDALERSPGYAALAALLDELFGSEVARALHAPFSLGDPRVLGELLARAGIRDARIATLEGRARFPSLASWLYTDIRGWTLAGALDDAQFARLSERAEHALAHFVGRDGSIAFPAPAHVVSATRA